MRNSLYALVLFLLMVPCASSADEPKSRKTAIVPGCIGVSLGLEGLSENSFVSADTLEPFELLGMTRQQLRNKLAVLQQSQTRTDYSSNLGESRIGMDTPLGERVMLLEWSNGQISAVGIPTNHQAGSPVKWLTSKSSALDSSINALSKTISDFNISSCFDSQSYDAEIIGLLKRRSKLLALAGRRIESQADSRKADKLIEDLHAKCSEELFECYQHPDSTEHLAAYLAKEFPSFVFPSCLHIPKSRQLALYMRYGFYPQHNRSVPEELARVDSMIPKLLNATRDFSDLLVMSSSKCLELKRLRMSNEQIAKAREECDHWYKCLLQLQNSNRRVSSKL